MNDDFKSRIKWSHLTLTVKEKRAINWIKKTALIDLDLGIQVNEKKSAY